MNLILKRTTGLCESAYEKIDEEFRRLVIESNKPQETFEKVYRGMLPFRRDSPLKTDNFLTFLMHDDMPIALSTETRNTWNNICFTFFYKPRLISLDDFLFNKAKTNLINHLFKAEKSRHYPDTHPDEPSFKSCSYLLRIPSWATDHYVQDSEEHPGISISSLPIKSIHFLTYFDFVIALIAEQKDLLYTFTLEDELKGGNPYDCENLALQDLR